MRNGLPDLLLLLRSAAGGPFGPDERTDYRTCCCCFIHPASSARPAVETDGWRARPNAAASPNLRSRSSCFCFSRPALAAQPAAETDRQTTRPFASLGRPLRLSSAATDGLTTRPAAGASPGRSLWLSPAATDGRATRPAATWILCRQLRWNSPIPIHPENKLQPAASLQPELQPAATGAATGCNLNQTRSCNWLQPEL